MKELLPIASTSQWEATVTDAIAPSDAVRSSVDLIRGTKLLAPPPSFLPYLIYEYGLGELTPYVPNLYDLIAEGIDWQRLRGTPSAIAMALGWLGYSAGLEEEDARRRFWNLFQLELDRIVDDEAELSSIAGVAGLSVPLRSKFWRGYHGLDIRPHTWSESSYSASHWGEYSGVRLADNGPLWSFGRKHEFDVTLSRLEALKINAWIEPNWLSLDEPIGWGDFTWEDTDATWVDEAEVTRANAMVALARGRAAWIVLIGEHGVIGYRRARAYRPVRSDFYGAYEIGGFRFSPTADAVSNLYVECQTGFGDAAGQRVTSVGVVLDGVAAKPGQMWVGAGELVGASEPIAVRPLALEMKESCRERIAMVLRFDGTQQVPNAMSWLMDEPNGVAFDFTDNSYARRTTSHAEVMIWEGATLAFDFRYNSYARLEEE